MGKRDTDPTSVHVTVCPPRWVNPTWPIPSAGEAHEHAAPPCPICHLPSRSCRPRGFRRHRGAFVSQQTETEAPSPAGRRRQSRDKSMFLNPNKALAARRDHRGSVIRRLRTARRRETGAASSCPATLCSIYGERERRDQRESSLRSRDLLNGIH